MPKDTSAVDLSHETIGDLDGGAAGLAIDAGLRAMIADLNDRGKDEKARKVTIVITGSQEPNGVVRLGVDVKTALPPYRTNTTLSQLNETRPGKAELLFQPDAPHNPHQETIPGTE